MNKEQVQKHKDVIKWFCDNPNKGVWFKQDENEWVLTKNPTFSTYENLSYVENDEYAEFRKALVDGKEIETLNTYALWDKMLGSNFHGGSDKYRMKPKETKFKVSDWVFDLNNHNKLLQVTKQNITNISTAYHKLWEPKKGKLCVFWDNNINDYFIGRYGDYCSVAENGIIYTEFEFEHIAPLEFIQTLKEQ